MEEERRGGPTIGSGAAQEKGAVRGTGRHPESARVIALRIDLEWRLHATTETFSPEGAELARKLENRDVREICADQPEVIDAIGRALVGENATSLVRFAEAAIETSYLPARDGSGSIVGVCALSVDVSDREAALREVRDDESRLRAYAQSSSELVTIQDLSGRFIWANDYHEKFLGLAPNELVGASALSLVHAERPEQTDRERRGDSRARGSPIA